MYPLQKSFRDYLGLHCQYHVNKDEWYGHGEKYKRFFLNFEKKSGNQNLIRKLIIKEKEISNSKEISNNIKVF